MRKRLGRDTTVTDTELGFMLKHSGEYEVEGDYWMPTWVEWTAHGYDKPDLFARIEIRDGKPEIVRLEWSANQYQREIKQRDVRNMEVSGLVEVLYAGLTYHVDPKTGERQRGTGEGDGGDHPLSFYAAQSFVRRQRRPAEYRRITPEFLEMVAQTYRENIDSAPTQAVAKRFGVKPRMASVYVDRARQTGLLSQTTQGKRSAK